MINKETDAILVVDLQNDFIDGSLAVPGAFDILPKVKEYVEKFNHRFFSADFHPVNHSSFKQQGGPWPPHCIAGTNGSSFHKILYPFVATIIKKGTEVEKDAYSAFDGTDLAKQLEEKGIKRLFVCGLATDYCVKATVLDACQMFNGEVIVLVDAIAAVNINVGDELAAVQDMYIAGASMSARPLRWIMNGTEKDYERTKRLFEDKDDTIERLKKELGRFIVQQCPNGWTREQVELLTLRRLLLEAAYYADPEWEGKGK